MSAAELSKQHASTDKLALENCLAQQVVQSMFEHVAEQDAQRLANRSDRREIARFCSTLVENELIFGSPSDEVLESVQRKILRGRAKQRES